MCLSSPVVVPVREPELARARASYGEYGCVQLDGRVDVAELRPVLRELYDRLAPVAEEQRAAHQVGPGTLAGGYRFARIDPAAESADAARRVAAAFAEVGLDTWTRELAKQARPWLQDITGYLLAYDRAFILVYREGDYIGPHGDRYEGHRINVQLPLTYHCVSGMRVLRDGFLETQYDRDGCLRVLGPRMWHEVPPLLRQQPDVAPLRLVLSLRMRGTPRDPARRHHGQVVA